MGEWPAFSRALTSVRASAHPFWPEELPPGSLLLKGVEFFRVGQPLSHPFRQTPAKDVNNYGL